MVWGTENATHGRAHLLVPEGCGPSAQVKSASRVLGRPARSLHDAIQRLKHATNDLAHVTPPVELPVFPKDDGSDHFPYFNFSAALPQPIRSTGGPGFALAASVAE